MATGILSRLLRHVERTPGKTLYTYLDKGHIVSAHRTYAQLGERVARIAGYLRARGQAEGRALLLYANPLEFVEAFLGCLAAGVTAVPVAVPSLKNLGTIVPIAQNAGVRCVLAGRREQQNLAAPFTAQAGALPWYCLADIDLARQPADYAAIEAYAAGCAARTAFLQYTSGSTGQPKGVVVTHANLAANEMIIADAMRIDSESVVVGWLPHYHDMGLIGNLLQPLYQGAQCVLMQPADFIQKPIHWLRAISQFRGTVSGGPNFAYDLCVARTSAEEREGLDLSHWNVAFTGAEPVRSATVERFTSTFARHGLRAHAIFPCYGMAESTLFIAGAEQGTGAARFALRADALNVGAAVRPAGDDDDDAAHFIGCGAPPAQTEVRIVHPDTGTVLADGQVGEIWVRGASVAAGYHGNAQTTAQVFGARLHDEPEARYLRTGDLGTRLDGQLLIVGRLKDTLIVRGRNYYPQDIEETAQQASPALATGGGAVFQCDERVVLVHELTRQGLRQDDHGAVTDSVRAAIVGRHGIVPHEIVLIKPGQLPRTTSGKVRRAVCRSMYQARAFEPLDATTLLEV